MSYTPIIPVTEPLSPPPGARPFGLWRLGFRPFFLLASGFAAMSITAWALQWAGMPGLAHLSGPLWHAHEMLFGFALAVIVGFLFTAGRNWSGQPTPTGPLLAALAALWLAARVLVLTPFGWAAALANVAFPLAAALALALPLAAARNRRNYFFVGLLLLMAAAAGAVHGVALQLVAMPAWLGIQMGLDVLLFTLVVMAGRVVPMFTNNGVPGANASRHPAVETLALGSVLALLAADTLQLHGAALTALLVLAAAAHGLRWLLWRPWKTLRQPLVWVLHAAYLWVPVHLALRTAAEQGQVTASMATHALTVGAVGAMVLGMMTRTSRGHTGRPLQADGFDAACYGLVLAAALVRVGLPFALPAATLMAVLASAALWSTAFALFTVRYWPVLTRERLDGKPG
jgi:uncharacterized protein involved in response to NO